MPSTWAAQNSRPFVFLPGADGVNPIVRGSSWREASSQARLAGTLAHARLTSADPMIDALVGSAVKASRAFALSHPTGGSNPMAPLPGRRRPLAPNRRPSLDVGERAIPGTQAHSFWLFPPSLPAPCWLRHGAGKVLTPPQERTHFGRR